MFSYHLQSKTHTLTNQSLQYFDIYWHFMFRMHYAIELMSSEPHKQEYLHQAFGLRLRVDPTVSQPGKETSEASALVENKTFPLAFIGLMTAEVYSAVLSS